MLMDFAPYMQSQSHLNEINFEQVDPKQFSCAVLINNAGSLGDKIKSIPNHTDVDKIREYMDLNITSSIYLT